MMTLEEISAQFEIRAALQRYSRGIDRRDVQLALSAYWPDALDTRPYGGPERWTVPASERMHVGIASFGDIGEYSQHHLTNVTVELDLENDRAVSEAYVIAFQPLGPSSSGAVVEAAGGDLSSSVMSLICGRYVDELARKDGEWRIQHRRFVVDFSRLHIAGDELFKDVNAALRPGAEDDPATRAFTSLR